MKKNYKYFIDYLYNDHKVKPLHIMLPKTSAYVSLMMDKLNGLIFLIEDVDLLEKYHSICDKISTNIKKNLRAGLSSLRNS